MKINSIIDLVKDLDTSRQTKNLNKLLIRILLHLQVEFSNGRVITDDYIEDYLKGSYVAYNVGGTRIDRLKQIWIQVYIARYYHMQYDDYFDYRRNTYPEFPINPDTNLNDDKTKIPMRWQYPENELLYNKEQYLIALDRQWGGTDNVNNVMWVLK